jgi:CTP-dependent riboflavin kinase
MLVGRVASGKGDLARWMRRYAAAYERVTGMTLCPGSLNVVLDEQWELPRERVRLEAPEVGVGVSLVRCTFLDRPAFIFRTDADDAKGPEQRAIIEILSDVHLRDTYGLEDGDSVEIRIPN